MEKVVIAMTTWYETMDSVRAKLALATVKEAKKCGHQIVIVDSSPKVVRNALQKQGAIVFSQHEKGMGSSRRQVIKEAVDIAGPDGIIAWVEAEKDNFVVDLGMIASVMKSQSADLVMPRRKSLESYPLFQQHFEFLGNQAFQMLVGRNFDNWFGPRIFRSKLACFFLNYKGEYGDKWDSIHVPTLRIIKAGGKVIEVEVDFTYSKKQRTEEEENYPMFKKRLEQLLNLVSSFEKECKLLGLP